MLVHDRSLTVAAQSRLTVAAQSRLTVAAQSRLTRGSVTTDARLGNH